MRIWIFWITVFFVGGTKSFLFGDGLYKVAVRTKQEKYLRGGSEEQITFYVPKDDTSHEMVARKGLLIKRPQAQATVLICHGFMCSKYETSFVRSIFGPSDDGLILNTMIFDFRAHGEDSQGQTCSFGKNEALDVIAAAQFLKNQPDLQGKPLIVYGFSMGAVASILAQSQRQNLFDFAIWDCPFDSFSNVINRAVDKLSFTCCGYEIQLPGRKFFNRYAYNPYVQKLLKFALKIVAQMDATRVDTEIVPVDTVEAMKKITIPCFLIVCRNDEKAPVEAVKANFDAARGYKKLWITNGWAHCTSMLQNPEKYMYKVRKFIKKGLSGELVGNMPKNQIAEDPLEEFIEK